MIAKFLQYLNMNNIVRELRRVWIVLSPNGNK